MKKINPILAVILFQISIAYSQTEKNDTPVLKGPYPGQTPPGNKSQIFAPGFVSTQFGELNSVFATDGTEFYFSRRGIPGKPSAIMVARMINNEWTTPLPVDFSGKYNDVDLFLTPGGKYFFYTSGRNGSEDIYWVSAEFINKLMDK